ncbi:hypothetical protein MSP8887_03318 [Marinomonas spartinae]|uniref:Uncharacterized protein n=1 Tax=Marinomonas spartinae TaxID=1792290 RepID=A0A1A8TMR1_9GAMM|nr:hypothetical protein [Marinomonas spartinae]SBS35020.1 hypothetical protein MSP8886_03237 [Marinomonas spartinae]SBS38463.1 hypothetical protein MSP8887_03318 [Marinomonas spartinae]
MPTKEINEFHVIDTIEEANKTPRVVLENNKLKKQTKISGKVLEAQYQIGENFLILVTEGNPFEEALYIYYFSASLQLMDSLELSATYAEGMVRNISLSDSGNINFSFFDNDEQWVLKVHSNPKFSFFSNKYPVKRKMSCFHKSWLSLSKS